MRLNSRVIAFAVVLLTVSLVGETGAGQETKVAGPVKAAVVKTPVINVAEQEYDPRVGLIEEIQSKSRMLKKLQDRITEAEAKARNVGKNRRLREEAYQELPAGAELAAQELEADILRLQDKLAKQQQQVGEIMALREGLGGSVVGSVLGDLELGNQTQEELQREFQAELARLVQDQQNEDVRFNYVQARPEVSATGGLSQPQAQAQVNTFRAVARQMEQLAWQLEEIEAYSEADRLRQQSTDLRQRARQVGR